MDGTTWSAPVAEGQGASTTTIVTFAPATARFIRITTTAADAAVWTVGRLKLYESP